LPCRHFASDTQDFQHELIPDRLSVRAQADDASAALDTIADVLLALNPAAQARPANSGVSYVAPTSHWNRVEQRAAIPKADELATQELAPADVKSDFLKRMVGRGFYNQATNLASLDEKLLEAETSGKPLKAYLGFDATANSLHVGSLLQIMILRHLQKAGHKPIVLVGGGTTKVGDPSGKDESRKMLTEEDIQSNIDGITSVFKKFLTFGEGATDAELVNNNDWLADLNYLEFLRDYGPHFTINRMMTYDSVKLRLEREQPLTFLEFNYMLLQAYDFFELNRRKGVELQIGGSDQWGNIVNGVELGRRVSRVDLFGLTAPLITKSDGSKMGKSASGAIWLNEELLSPYDYWQFWRNVDDADVGRFLKIFTELPLDEIERLASLPGKEINAAKEVLADEVTTLLHGADKLPEIKATAKAVFAGGGASDEGLPTAPGNVGDEVVDLYIAVGFAKSKSEARRLIQGGGARINGEKIGTDDTYRVLADGDFNEEGKMKLSSGKKKHAIILRA
jgi:tyrosyl-tRNA synthetase